MEDHLMMIPLLSAPSSHSRFRWRNSIGHLCSGLSVSAFLLAFVLPLLFLNIPFVLIQFVSFLLCRIAKVVRYNV